MLSDWRWLSPGAQVPAVLLGGLIVGLELCITPELMICALAFGGLVAGLQGGVRAGPARNAVNRLRASAVVFNGTLNIAAAAAGGGA